MFFVSMMDKEHADFDKVFQDIKRPPGARMSFRSRSPSARGMTSRASSTSSANGPISTSRGRSPGNTRRPTSPRSCKGSSRRWRRSSSKRWPPPTRSSWSATWRGKPSPRRRPSRPWPGEWPWVRSSPSSAARPRRAIGMKALLTKMVELFPHPGEMPGEKATRPGLDQEVTLVAEDSGPTAALIFKTATEPHVGELSFFKVLSGVGRERDGAQERRQERLGEAEPPQHSPGEGAPGGPPPPRRGHRRGGQAEGLPHQRHAVLGRTGP